MSVQLPTGGVKAATPRFLDRGGLLRAQFAGADQRLDRLGSKWGVDVQVKPLKADDARIWIARLIRGMREKALLRFPQPGWTQPFTASNVLVNGANASNLETLNLKSATIALAGSMFKEGQFFSVYRSGIRFIYQATADAAWANVGGTAQVAVPVQPPLRVSYVDGDLVDTNFSLVQIEGYVIGDKRDWSIDEARVYGLGFSIEEAQ